MKLGLGLSLANRSGAGGLSSPIPPAGLSLWLKADAGITRLSYTYKSRITLSGADSSINGVYEPNGIPSNGATSYTMNGPNNNKILVTPSNSSNQRYRLYNTANFTYPNPWYYDFNSFHGSTWYVVGKKPISVTISGLTGASATSSSGNGTYNAFQWEAENGSFQSYKQVQGGYDTNRIMEIYPNGSASLFSTEGGFFVLAEKVDGWGIGTWDIIEGTGEPVGAGSFFPQGSAPTGVVETATIVTNQVTTWLDQSPISNPVYPYGSPSFNDNDVNGKPSLTFAGHALALGENYNIMGATGSTAFAVTYANDVCSTNDDSGPIFGNFGDTIGNDPASQSHYPYGGDCKVYDAFATENRKNSLTPPVPIVDNWSVYSVYSTNNDWKSYVNGTLMHSDPNNVYNNQVGGMGDPRQLYIGYQDADGAYYYKGKIAEVAVYNRVLTTEERQKVEAYLMAKYGITPPTPPTTLPLSTTNLYVSGMSFSVPPDYSGVYFNPRLGSPLVKQSDTFWSTEGNGAILVYGSGTWTLYGNVEQFSEDYGMSDQTFPVATNTASGASIPLTGWVNYGGNFDPTGTLVISTTP